MPEATVSTPAVAGTAPAVAGAVASVTTGKRADDNPANSKPSGKPNGATGDQGTGRSSRIAALAKANAEAAKASKPAETAKPDAATEAATVTAEAAKKVTEEAGKKPAGNGYSAKRIAELEAENATLKTSSRDALIAELKASPGKIFKLIGDPELLTKLAEAKAKGDDPEEVIRDAVAAATKPLIEKQSAAEEAAKKAETARVAAILLNETKALFNEGYKEGEETVADPVKWKLSAKLTKAGVIDAPAEAYATMSRMATDIQRKLKDAGKPARQFTNKEAATMLAVSFDAIEARETAKAAHYRAEEETPKSATGEGKKVVRTQITSRIGYGQTVGRETKDPTPRNAHERREQRLAKIK